MDVFTITLNGAAIRTEEAFHAAIKEQSGIEWYGCNLDALDEMLSFIISETKGPFRIIWENADLSYGGFGERYLMIVGLMKEAEERFPDRFLGLSMTFAKPYFDEGQHAVPQRAQ
jgi:RNAse (barnase) inhibitor barstar